MKEFLLECFRVSAMAWASAIAWSILAFLDRARRRYLLSVLLFAELSSINRETIFPPHTFTNPQILCRLHRHFTAWDLIDFTEFGNFLFPQLPILQPNGSIFLPASYAAYKPSRYAGN